MLYNPLQIFPKLHGILGFVAFMGFIALCLGCLGAILLDLPTAETIQSFLTK